MLHAFEVTRQDIAFILRMHDVRLPTDVIEAIHDEIINELDDIIPRALKHSTELTEQNEYVMSKIEDILIRENLYIKEPKRLETYHH
jgi:hypothetical protein